MEIIREVECEQVNKNLQLSINYETFVVGGPSELLLEPLKLNPTKKFYLLNDNSEEPLAINKSTHIAVLKPGRNMKIIKLWARDTKLSSCEQIAAHLMLTVLPL